MKYIKNLLEKGIVDGNQKVLLEPIAGKNQLRVTITRNLNGAHSENELVRNEKHCKVLNIYRDGKKSGMQLIKTELVNLDEILNTEMGDNNTPPVKGHALTVHNPNDTAL